MRGPRRPQGDELLRRMAAWGDEWRAVARATDRADRPRAEAALRSLYRAAARPEPTVAWVPSPAAGVLAYTFASLRHAGVGSRNARGDVGTGGNREFNGLAAPFGMEPAWTYRLAAQVLERVPPEHRPPEPPRRPGDWWMRPVREPAAVASEALGIGSTARTMALVRAAASAGSLRQARIAGRTGGAEVADGHEGADGAGATGADDLVFGAGAAVLGPDWDRLVEALGRVLARGVFVEAMRRLAMQVLVDPDRRRTALHAMQPGQWDDLTPVLAASRDVFGGFVWRHRAGREEREAEVEARLELACSAGPWWALDGLAIVSERPLVVRCDDRGRPHAADGPALAWADGLEAYAWHGVTVERWVIANPDRITVERIDAERNVEVRRVLVERFGEARLVREGGSTLVHADETGRLWRRDIEPRPAWASSWWQPSEEPVTMVEVVNSTPEPDGTRRTYFLRVPPTMETAREAVAWTFGMGAAEYRPARET